MKTVCSFVAKFASLISWDLSCFDRVIFKGHLPFSYAAKFAAFVDYQLKMRRADFMQVVAPAWSERLVEHGKAYAQKHNRLYEYYQGDIDKDAWAKEQWHKQPVSDGLIGVLCVMESCPTFKLAHGEGRPCFVSRRFHSACCITIFGTRIWACCTFACRRGRHSLAKSMSMAMITSCKK